MNEILTDVCLDAEEWRGRAETAEAELAALTTPTDELSGWKNHMDPFSLEVMTAMAQHEAERLAATTPKEDILADFLNECGIHPCTKEDQ